MKQKTTYEPFEKARPFGEFPSRPPFAQAGLIKHLTAKSESVAATNLKTVIAIGPHRYYNQLSAQLVECHLTTNGELKNPCTVINPLDLVWSTQSAEEIKFYASLIKFQNFYEKSGMDGVVVKALVDNPLRYEFYYHDSSVSEKITARSLLRVDVSRPELSFKVRVNENGGIYSAAGELYINHRYCPLNRIALRFDHFVVQDDHWYLCEHAGWWNAISYFKKHEPLQLAHEDFRRFQKEVLAEIETCVEVEHEYLHQATPAQLQAKGFDQSPEKLIYLSDLGEFVMIDPVMVYGDIEIPVLSKKQIYAEDTSGKSFLVKRDAEAENEFTALLVRQHPDFLEQLDNPLAYFYLHRVRFLDEEWFLGAFEEWTRQGITVLGFNELKGSKINPRKARISIQVASGLNWFNTQLSVSYGGKKASLKQLRKAVKNKSKYVQLDDGTQGIIPEEWLSKFESYFNAGTIVDDTLQMPKTNYEALTELYEAHMLDEEVKAEVNRYRAKLSGFKSMEAAEVPEGLQGTLRPYQRQGLSWLNFLDDFNFGGCLADDMGLGKSIQIIAFILLQQKKNQRNANLLVVPTSLVHSWQEEVQKFAPSLRLYILHGANRLKSAGAFGKYDVIITTYNTMVSDVGFLKQYEFNYVFLDESQNIKNLGSQRYKAACLLKSRNKVVISGTPLENNTFDIYAQLSFACPGLLGTRHFFRNTYAIPIDRFKIKRSANALQEKISPFVLRRTKKEVAAELPEKTEIVLHCEMGSEQRAIYDFYEKEFREYLSAKKEDEIAKNPMHVLKGITRLRQICNSPLLIGDEKLAEMASSKIDMLMEKIKGISRDHKVLVFSQFVSMLNLVKEELNREEIKHTMLTGSTTNRGEIVNQFQQDEATRVFLISLKAGGTGLNLTAADYVFIVDPWWNPAVENQAIDRCYRIGQEKKVIAVRLICPDTVEEKIQVLQEHKSGLVSSLISTGDSFFKSLTKRDLLGLAGVPPAK